MGINKTFKSQLTATINRKGVLDIDSVKGCYYGMKKYSNGGCYGLCYAAKTSMFRGFNFNESISRSMKHNKSLQLRLFDKFYNMGDETIFKTVEKHDLKWFRIGTMGDPCHDWKLTYDLCEWLYRIKIPVIVTKHWIPINDELLNKFKKMNVVFNTSISPLDKKKEIEYRLKQFVRIRGFGIKSFLRIVSCEFGKTSKGKNLNEIQKFLFKHTPFIDNPLRIPINDKRVVEGHIIITQIKDLNKISSISKFNKNTYIGKCHDCPDQCGVT